MNTDLMRVVEQVVRPLPALKVNKMRMRMELYTLLEQIYQEELSQDGTSETAALERASRRFGDPELLRGELLQTIPLSERAWTIADRLLVRRREGEGLVCFCFRIGLHACLGMVLFGLLLYVVATFQKNDPPELSFWGWWTLAILTVGVNSFCLTLLGNVALAGFRQIKGRTRFVGPLRFILCTLAAGLLIASSEVLNMYYLVGPYWKLGYAEPFLFVGMITGTMFAVIVWLRAREDAQFQPWNEISLPSQPSAMRGTA
ncbi:hypothetical protein Pan97_07880 [Bremerella volcania]|uniref:Uncharacterized protein n=1 Tax=Bremerella volcania TaxID=2527984 RepID=A0A518C3I8_9BACT|nr:hypothetical protein [Bremerella volcania]QDU73788.1 hypothetical protein Pan97_07880 [Bremerella volcania]